MSELTKSLETLEVGELSVIALKLASMQAEISNALSTIQTLTTEVEGSSTDTSNPVGVIHSPARAGNISTSKEMFIGTYYIGDILANQNAKVGHFIFGAGSDCKFYFMPSDPLHAVNKKYVDQVINPLVTQLGNMIVRTGDCIPSNPNDWSIGAATYIYNNNGGALVRWLLDGLIAGVPGTSRIDDFNLTGGSAFFLNVDDARYYGTTTDPYNILTKHAGDNNYLAKGTNTSVVVNIAGTSGNPSSFIFDINSKIQCSRTAVDPNDVLTLKDLPSVNTIPKSGIWGRYGCTFNNSKEFVFNTSDKHFNDFTGDSLYEFFEEPTGSYLTCKKACTVSVLSNMLCQVGNNDGWPADIHLLLKQTTITLVDERQYIETRDQNQGYTHVLSLHANTFITLAIGDTISLVYTDSENKVQTDPTGQFSICVING